MFVINLSFSIVQGGIKAVIWTDVFQLIVMTGGLIAIIIKVYIYCYHYTVSKKKKMIKAKC